MAVLKFGCIVGSARFGALQPGMLERDMQGTCFASICAREMRTMAMESLLWVNRGVQTGECQKVKHNGVNNCRCPRDLGIFEANVLGDEVGIREWDIKNSGYRNSC